MSSGRHGLRALRENVTISAFPAATRLTSGIAPRPSAARPVADAPPAGLLLHLQPGWLTGAVIASRYEVGGLLGAGGVAEVYEARHLLSRRTVAVKVLQRDRDRTRLRERRTRTEAQSLADLEHPNVVSVLDMDDDPVAGPFLVMERLRGRPLAALLRVAGRLSQAEALAAVGPIADAVAEAHRRGIVHRDLKPENIFIAETPRGAVPKLLDFGIAKDIGGAATFGAATPTATLLGTPAYMAPEQINGESAISASADVWALGVILYEALLGALPFRGHTVPGLLEAIVRGEYLPLSEQRVVAVDPNLAAVVQRCLARRPTDRYRDAGALSLALSSLA